MGSLKLQCSYSVVCDFWGVVFCMQLFFSFRINVQVALLWVFLWVLLVLFCFCLFVFDIYVRFMNSFIFLIALTLILFSVYL